MIGSPYKFFLALVKKMGIATEGDIRLLQDQINAMDKKWQEQIADLRGHYDTFTVSFANHKSKTEDELKGFVADISQIIVAMELLLKTAHSELHVFQIKHMITALKSKKTKAETAVKSISRANSEGQIDIALAEAANG